MYCKKMFISYGIIFTCSICQLEIAQLYRNTSFSFVLLLHANESSPSETFYIIIYMYIIYKYIHIYKIYIFFIIHFLNIF